MEDLNQYYINISKNKRYSFRYFETVTGEEISLERLKDSNIWQDISPKERERLTKLLSNNEEE